MLRVPSRTTLIGVTPDAQLSGGMRLENVEDVIVRHLRLSDAYDHLPAWDPKGNGHGEWGTANGTASTTTCPCATRAAGGWTTARWVTASAPT